MLIQNEIWFIIQISTIVAQYNLSIEMILSTIDSNLLNKDMSI